MLPESLPVPLGGVLLTSTKRQRVHRLRGHLGLEDALAGASCWSGAAALSSVSTAPAMRKAVMAGSQPCVFAWRPLPLLIGRPWGSVTSETFTCTCSSLESLALP